jgi:peptidyl-tRNA hydrolase
VKRLDAAGEVSGKVTTDIPASTTFLFPHCYLNNGGTAAAVVLDFYRYYLETDY